MQGHLATSQSNLNYFMGWKVVALTYNIMVVAAACLEQMKTVIYNVFEYF